MAVSACGLHDASPPAAEAVRQQAHSFKGSSGNLGALRVTGICLEIEQYARERDLAAAGTLMEALENQFRSPATPSAPVERTPLIRGVDEGL